MVGHTKTPSVEPLKGRYPFRLATTSFIYPAGWAENVARLASGLDEVELLFFESQSPGSLPDGDEIDRLAGLAAEHDLTYTVHLPVDVNLGSIEKTNRQTAAATLARIYRRTAPLPVTSYTLHLAYPPEAAREEGAVRRWQDGTRAGLGALLDTGVEPARLSIENLDYPFEWSAPLVESLNLRVCLDIGHLIIYGKGPSTTAAVSSALDRYLPRTTVIHLHGVADGKDHRPLDELDTDLLEMILERLRHFRASLSLEVFGLEALQRSLACFEAAWEKTISKD